MAPWHAILRATPFAPSSPCAQGDILSPSEPYLLPAMRNPCAAKIDSALAIRESGRRSGTPGALAYMVAANLRPRALGRRGEGIEPTPGAPIGLAGPASARPTPNSSRASAFPACSCRGGAQRLSVCLAPIDPAADVPAGQRPVPVSCFRGGPSFVQMRRKGWSGSSALPPALW
jgi:hypothetical protein